MADYQDAPERPQSEDVDMKDEFQPTVKEVGVMLGSAKDVMKPR